MIRRQAESDRDDETDRNRQHGSGRSGSSRKRRATVAKIQRSVGNQAVQRLADAVGAGGDGGASTSPSEIASEGVSGPGRRLPHLDEVEPVFPGADLSTITAHVGGRAREAAERLGATAYATGDAVAFRRPPEPSLVVHEVTHVLQQRAGRRDPTAVGRSDDRHEGAARRAAATVRSGPTERSEDAAAGPGTGRRPSGRVPGVQLEEPTGKFEESTGTGSEPAGGTESEGTADEENARAALARARREMRAEVRRKKAHFERVQEFRSYLTKKMTETMEDPERMRVRNKATRLFDAWIKEHEDDIGSLRARSPALVYLEIRNAVIRGRLKEDPELTAKQLLGEEEPSEEERERKERKRQEMLDRYHELARKLYAEAYKPPHSHGRYLVRVHPMRRKVLVAFAERILNDAYERMGEAEFLEKAPAVRAKELASADPMLRYLLNVAREQPIQSEYIPADEAQQSLSELGLELLVGFTPVIGDVADAMEAITGESLTGYDLSGGERVLSAVAVLVPIASSKAIRTLGAVDEADETPELVGRIAKRTGRSAGEVEAVFRLAGSLDEQDVKTLRTVLEAVSEGEEVSPKRMKGIIKVLEKLRNPLEESVTFRPSKLYRDPFTGQALEPGTAAHKRQRWFRYQLEQGAEEFSTDIDPKWAKQYESIIQNARKGRRFERRALQKGGWEKNTHVFMDPARHGEKGAGFIPDALVNHTGPVKWGEPYHFVEVKRWEYLSDTGNLKQMLNYVENNGGKLTLVVAGRGEKWTDISSPLMGKLERLEEAGKAELERLETLGKGASE